MTAKFKRTAINSTNVRLDKIKQKIIHNAMGFLINYTPAFSKRLINKAFFTPAAYRLTPLEKDYLENSEMFTISVHDKIVRCWKWGSGPGILLVHGWNGRGIQLHRFIDPLVRSGYSAITFDAPGHGQSQGKTSSYFEFTDAIQAFLGSSNGYHIQGIIAHSLGASAVINCLSKTNRPQAPVLIAPALKLAELVSEMFNHYGVSEHIYQNMIGKLEAQYGYSMQRDNPYNLAKKIESKMLIVHDRDDPTTPYIDSKALSEKSINVLLHTTQGLGHKRILRDNAVIDVTVDFIRRSTDGDSHIDSMEEKNEKH